MKKLVLIRRFSQIFFLAAFIYVLWSTAYPLKGILPADIFFKLDPLVTIFISISEKVMLPGIIFSLLMLFLTVICGRFFCGWVCPLGTMIDMMGVRCKNRKADFISFKYYLLSVIFVASMLGLQVAWILDPMVITARFVSLNLIPWVTFSLNKVFIFLIQKFNFFEPLYDFYRFLKSSLLGIQVYCFSHSLVIFAFFIIILLLCIITKRFWCRAICPLGALYSIIAKCSILHRIVDTCTQCFRCEHTCRMQAINHDMSYKKGECILCMDCIYDCPPHGTRFGWRKNKAVDNQVKGSISRKEFLFFIVSSFFLLGFTHKKSVITKTIIRPPGVLDEHKFLNTCVRCGNCMKACPTNGLQPVMFETGIQGIWTPKLVPEIGWCEYNCNLCGNVCPTQAIPKLDLHLKQKTPLGLAHIDRSFCIPWASHKECIVCEEHCPIPTKAIKLDKSTSVAKPIVDAGLCIGCGICQNKCPVRPLRAIRVFPF